MRSPEAICRHLLIESHQKRHEASSGVILRGIPGGSNVDFRSTGRLAKLQRTASQGVGLRVRSRLILMRCTLPDPPQADFWKRSAMWSACRAPTWRSIRRGSWKRRSDMPVKIFHSTPGASRLPSTPAMSWTWIAGARCRSCQARRRGKRARRSAPIEFPPEAGKAIRDRTTGSSGSAFHFLRSEAALIADAANSLRVFRDHRFDPEARFADIRSDLSGMARYPDGALRPSWSHGDGAGDYAILDINTPLEQQIEWLSRMRPSIIFTWPSNLRALALEMESRGERLPVHALATSAESSTAGLRADCERVFGAVPVDIFGAREIGIIAWRCHAGLNYHLAAESALIEIIRDDGEPARPGETGRLVATPFYNLHTPFIRYETGDYLTLASEPCGCGRSLPSISRICGRARSRLRLV